jgi:beta-lactamase class A
MSPLLDLRKLSTPATAPVVAAVVPTPLEVLANTQTVVEERDHVSIRPLIAFGLVAVALAASGAATVTSAQRVAQTATARSVATDPSASTKIPLPAVVPIKNQLQSLLDQFVAPDRSEWGIVVTNLKTGETASVNPDVSMTSASLYKLFVAKSVYKAIDDGTLSYSQAAGGGSGMDIQDCLSAMITVSDNTCGRALGTLVGWDALNPVLASQGFTGTNMANPIQQTSPHDVALIFQRLYQNSLNSHASNAAFLSLLKQQKVNNRLPVGLPAGTVIAHKTGDLYGYTHDAGIVYGPKSDYLVVVMSGSWDAPGDAVPRFAQLSTTLYNYFEN